MILIPHNKSKDHYSNYTSFIFCQIEHFPKVRFEKMAANIGNSGVYIAPNTARLGIFKDFQRHFGYLGT